jgi:nitroimidazol reductase NimA-like FMN-containing flavoprotein (pyridoxamine 5'-phosphate oxidase superfamily)
MATRDPVDVKNIDGYGAPVIPWERARTALEQTEGMEHRYWLATASPVGRPHAVPIGAIWLDGALYFTSGAGTRKSRDLAANQRCVLTIAAPGLDIVVEGQAVKVRDDAKLQHLAETYRAGGRPATVSNGAFTAEYSAPSAGPPPWDVYEVVPETVFGLGTAEPYGATRWRF